MSKSFQVPQPVIIKPWASSAPDVAPVVATFLAFATFTWLEDPRGLTDAQGKSSIVQQNRWFALIDKFEAAKVGDWITLEDADYVALRKIVESPARAFEGVRGMRACVSFSDVVLKAVDKIPPALVAAETAQA